VWNPAASEQVLIQLAEPPVESGSNGQTSSEPDPSVTSESLLAAHVREVLLAGIVPISPPTLTGPHVLVAKVLVFVAVFAPFLFALESFVRQRQNQLQPIYLAAARSSWLSYSLAKVVAAVVVGVVVLVSGLVVAGALFGLLPTNGLPEMVVLYVLAATASASLGVSIAAMVESNRALGAVVGYFLALLLFGGVFLPLSSASPIVQAASYAFPLRFPMHEFHMWLMQGQAFNPIRDLSPGAPLAQSGFEIAMFGGLVLVYFLVALVALAWRRAWA
jgi:ABC-type multidrug transport system permease subunit